MVSGEREPSKNRRFIGGTMAAGNRGIDKSKNITLKTTYVFFSFSEGFRLQSSVC